MGLFGGGNEFDAREAAKVQQKYGTIALKEAAKINQIGQQGPFGSVRFEGEVGTPERTQITELNPLGQQQLTNQQQLGVNLSNFGLGQLGAVQAAQGQPLNFGGLPNMQSGMDARNAAESALMERMNPQLDRQRAAMETQLANQGITRGSEAYRNAMSDMGQQQNDARLGAILAAGQEQQRQFGLDQAARQQGIGEIMMQRQTPMNEFLAMQSGTPQVPVPQANPMMQQGMQTPDVMGGMAAQAQASAANNQAMLGGLFGLGSAGIMAGLPLMMSDEREKENIRKVGKTDGGQNIYTYNYKRDPSKLMQMGVMAQESPKQAVGEILLGDGSRRLGVDYGAIR